MASIFICRCHNQDNQGVKPPGGLSEWQLAPAINSTIRDQLWLANHHPYRLSRGTLKTRVDAVNAMCAQKVPHLSRPPHLAIEVHQNWSDDPDRQGFFVMAHKGSRRGRALALSITNSMAQVLGHDKNRGVNKVDSKMQWIGRRYQYKVDRQYFLCQTVCPAVLVECGFLSNPEEAAWIAEIENRSRLGKSIGVGINEYLEGVSDD